MPPYTPAVASLGTILGIGSALLAGAGMGFWIASIRSRPRIHRLQGRIAEIEGESGSLRTALAAAQERSRRDVASAASVAARSTGEIAALSARLAQSEEARAALHRKAAERIRTQASAIARLEALNARLARWRSIVDAEGKARELLEAAMRDARLVQDEARAAAAEVERAARAGAEAIQGDVRRLQAELQARAEWLESEVRARLDGAEAQLAESRRVAGEEARSAKRRASAIIEAAEASAKEIAGEAWAAREDLGRLERLARAIENQVGGYGDRYLVPMYSVIDDLGESMSHEDVGRALKEARAASRSAVERGAAAGCDYADASRRATALRFVLDAFNGKVDAILARVRADNVGTLEQQVRDSFEIVNHLGSAFRNARILPGYLECRLAELRLAAAASHLRDQERQEQRRIKEQAREEERARREAERAQREAAKAAEAEARAVARLRSELESAQARERQQLERSIRDEVARADAARRAELEASLRTDAERRLESQRAEYESRISERDARLQEALARGQRARSMAEQTKRGHVYIVSNVGSFGEGIYKIGLTRRLDPMDRIWELGDASVPFDFDVHAMILSDDAPALETRLHRHFLLAQVNKVNPRKEFFRIGLSDLRAQIEGFGIEAHWTLASAAAEYRETLAIERRLSDDPAAKEAWLQGQMLWDPQAEPADRVPLDDEVEEREP